MQESDGKNTSSVSGFVVFLLLFIGFVFGLVVGFGTKDTVMRSYSKLLGQFRQADRQAYEAPLPPADTNVTESTDELIIDAVKKEEEKKPEDDTKKEEEKKPADDTKKEPQTTDTAT